MKTFLLIGAVLVLAAGAWLVDRGGIFRTEHRAYRFEVTVDTPEGLKTAYSVHEVTIQDQTWTPARTNQIKLVGEAVPFVLKDGRILFATLEYLPSGYPFEALLGRAIPNGKWIDIQEQFDFSLNEKSWPRLALIDAADKPETLRMLDGRGPFPKTVLGIGKEAFAKLESERVPDPMESQFKVVGARIVSTDEEMTSKVSEVLPWLLETIETAPYSARQTTDLQLMAFTLKTGVRG